MFERRPSVGSRTSSRTGGANSSDEVAGLSVSMTGDKLESGGSEMVAGLEGGDSTSRGSVGRTEKTAGSMPRVKSTSVRGSSGSLAKKVSSSSGGVSGESGRLENMGSATTSEAAPIEEAPRGFKSMLASFEQTAREEVKYKKEYQKPPVVVRASVPEALKEEKEAITETAAEADEPMELIDDEKPENEISGAVVDSGVEGDSGVVVDSGFVVDSCVVVDSGNVFVPRDLKPVVVPPGVTPDAQDVALQRDEMLRIGSKISFTSIVGNDTLVVSDDLGRIMVWSMKQGEMISTFEPEKGERIAYMKVLEDSSDDVLNLLTVSEGTRHLKTWLLCDGNAILVRSIELPQSSTDLLFCVPMAKKPLEEPDLEDAVDVTVERTTEVVLTADGVEVHDTETTHTVEMKEDTLGVHVTDSSTIDHVDTTRNAMETTVRENVSTHVVHLDSSGGDVAVLEATQSIATESTAPNPLMSSGVPDVATRVVDEVTTTKDEFLDTAQWEVSGFAPLTNAPTQEVHHAEELGQGTTA